MVLLFPSAGSPGREGIMRTSVLAAASPLRPTAAKTPERMKGDMGSDAANAAAERSVQEELKELKAMYRKVVEAHRSLRADFRICEEQRSAAEIRALAAESKLSKCRCGAAAPSQTHSSGTSRTSDASDLSNAMPTLGQSISVVDIPSSAASTECPPCCGAEDLSKGLSAGCQGNVDTASQPVLAESARASDTDDARAKIMMACPRVPPPIPSTTINIAQRRLSFSGTGGTDLASGQSQWATPRKARRDSLNGDMNAGKEAQPTETTPIRPKQGFMIVSTPQSASVRDRIRALESGGTGRCETPRHRSPSVRDRVRALEGGGRQVNS